MLLPDTYLFRRHRILAVRLAGGTYTTDVGFATENARVPLLLAEGVVQRDGHCAYRYQQEEFYGWVQCQRRPGHDWERIQAFTLEPQIDRDFDPVLFFFEKSPASNMNQFPRPPSIRRRGCWPSAGMFFRWSVRGWWYRPPLPRRRRSYG